DLAADAQDHRPVATDQLAERQLARRVPILAKPPQELGIAQPAHRPNRPERLELPAYLARLAMDHRQLSSRTAHPINKMHRTAGAIQNSSELHPFSGGRRSFFVEQESALTPVGSLSDTIRARARRGGPPSLTSGERDRTDG